MKSPGHLPLATARPSSNRGARGPESADAAFDVTATSTEGTLVRLEHCAKTKDELQRAHRRVTLGAVANEALTADEAIVRVDTVRRLNALAHHAWRSAAQLVARGA